MQVVCALICSKEGRERKEEKEKNMCKRVDVDARAAGIIFALKLLTAFSYLGQQGYKYCAAYVYVV